MRRVLLEPQSEVIRAIVLGNSPCLLRGLRCAHRVPELAGHEDVLALDSARSEHLGEGRADFFLVAVARGAVNVLVASLSHRKRKEKKERKEER